MGVQFAPTSMSNDTSEEISEIGFSDEPDEVHNLSALLITRDLTVGDHEMYQLLSQVVKCPFALLIHFTSEEVDSMQ